MLLIIYMMFSISLYFWTVNSIAYDSVIPKIEYMLGIILLATFFSLLWRVDKDKLTVKGILISGIFMNLGLSVDYRVWENVGNKDLMKDIFMRYTADLILMLTVFGVLYLLVGYTRIYKYRIWNYLLLLVLPIVIYGARITGHKTGGSYLYFGGIMIFGLVLMGFPFVAAWFLARREERYFGKKHSVKNLSWNLVGLLIYTFLLFGGCVVCNEFGLLLVLGLTITVLFMINCKNWLSKLVYAAACFGGVVLAGVVITHLNNRILIWLRPSQSYWNDKLAGQAESVLYVFRHIEQMGWWGKGIGNLSERIFPTLNTDHVLITMLNDYSVLIVGSILLLTILFVRWLLQIPANLCLYDRYLNLVCGLIICFIILIDVASNLGSFITAGIGFPLISDGGSANIMLTALMSVHCGLIRKGNKQYA